MAQSGSLVEALDAIRAVLERIEQNTTLASDQSLGLASAPSSESTPNIEFPLIAVPPFEQVLAFTTDEEIFLKGLPDNPFFSAKGKVIDFQHNPVPGGFSRLSFPIADVDLRDLNLWPRPQPEPFNEPVLFKEPTERHGFSKQAYFFDDGKSSLVTVGPSLPKVIRLKEGGAQFWVGSTGVITQGTGRFEGARGIAAYNGSAHFEIFPESPEELFANLQKGFKALVSAYFKLVFSDVLVEPTIVQPPQPAQKVTERRRRTASVK